MSIAAGANPVFDWPGVPALTPAAAQAPTSNTNAVGTLAADTTGKSWRVAIVRWSYTATPTNGQLTVAWGSNTETYYISNGGPGFLPMKRVFPPNTAVVFTLAAGGSGISGSVYPDAILD